MHLDEERLQRLLHGELRAGEEAPLRAHLSECAECRRHLDEAERQDREMEELLGALDSPAPRGLQAMPGWAREIAAGRRDVDVESHGHEPVPLHREPALLRREPVLLRRAAALVAAVAVAGAAYAIPGSPLPRWVREVTQWMQTEREVVDTHPGGSVDSASGIAVSPGSGLVIEFVSRQAAGEIRVTLTDGAELTVRAPAEAATFTTDAAHLTVENRGDSASFEVRVPRAAPRVEIRLAGAPVLLKEGERVTLAAPTGEGEFRIPLARP
jgi:hypothetical protein